MITTMHRWGRMAAAWGLTVAALLLLAGPVRCDGGGEWNLCQRAMLNCLAKGFGSGSLASQITVLIQLEYCLAGYDFCRRYVMYYV